MTDELRKLHRVDCEFCSGVGELIVPAPRVYRESWAIGHADLEHIGAVERGPLGKVAEPCGCQNTYPERRATTTEQQRGYARRWALQEQAGEVDTYEAIRESKVRAGLPVGSRPLPDRALTRRLVAEWDASKRERSPWAVCKDIVRAQLGRPVAGDGAVADLLRTDDLSDVPF